MDNAEIEAINVGCRKTFSDSAPSLYQMQFLKHIPPNPLRELFGYS